MMRPRPRIRLAAIVQLSLAAAMLAGCGGDPLEPWHEEYLDEEFRVGMMNDVKSFTDYLALEDRLFRQLDLEVYSQVATGPRFGLVRFSKGSASDPQSRNPNWNRSFELTADNPKGGVLLLHGMSDAPYSMRTLGESLNARGYWVIGLRLPGHGTAPSGLLRVRWQDMAGAVELAARHLSERVGAAPLHMVGYSNGAPLALNYTLDALDGEIAPVPASLVLISPAIGLATGAGLASLKRAMANIPGLGRWIWIDVQPEFDPYKYNSFATNAGAQVFALTQRVAERIASRADSGVAQVLPPVLVFKSTVDATTSTLAVVDNLLRHLRPNRHELVLYDINRFSRIVSVLTDDPGPLTSEFMNDATLPFAVTLVTNHSPQSLAVVAQRKPPFSNGLAAIVDLGLDWPRDILSLSHVALPFPPDDPLYGREPPPDGSLFLGQQAIQGERGLIRIPASYFIRLRHNPFYEYQNARTLAWLEAAGIAN
ncbi:MAG: alpha/beta hydrolase [Chromatiales bacterium]|nr:MAG: alpha/beta hydrolase [Chromatiales bacterium]